MTSTAAAPLNNTTSSENVVIERFVPVGDASLLDDAPGWSSATGRTSLVISTSNQQPSNKQPFSQKDSNDQNKPVKEDTQGPTCWKCKGSGLGKMPKKRRRHDAGNAKSSVDYQLTKEPEKESTHIQQTNRTSCSVCQGKGYLPPKLQAAKALQDRPGEITRVRKCPPGWVAKGPLPDALRQQNEDLNANDNRSNVGLSYNENQAIRLVKLAESTKTEVAVILPTDNDNIGDSCQKNNAAEIANTIKDIKTKSPFRATESIPAWIPRRGEQLCNLVGSFRILQRVASHRWTTDDLVTSYLAGQYLSCLAAPKKSNKTPLRYLDLGCGNGSVLQMTAWQLMQMENHDQVICRGIEARQEAVQLARRSIAFNIGSDSIESSKNGDQFQKHPSVDIQVHHGDFRSFFDQHESFCESFDLVTGTPPYFRVDFAVTDKTEQSETTSPGEEHDRTTRKMVQKAVINQGGMPSCKQSAPARCEFRGGVEAYCKAASKAMHSQSLFCVCENWLNDDRVYQGAEQAGLVVVEVLPVKGRTGKPCPLFAVYAMRKASFYGEVGSESVPETKVLDVLTVRDDQGNWTEEYQKVLQAMSIPVIQSQCSPIN